MRRLEGQHLLVFLQRGFDLNQWRARTRGDDQLGGLIINDAAMRRDVQHVTLHRTTEEGLQITTGDAQRRLARERIARLRLELRRKDKKQREKPQTQEPHNPKTQPSIAD